MITEQKKLKTTGRTPTQPTRCTCGQPFQFIDFHTTDPQTSACACGRTATKMTISGKPGEAPITYIVLSGVSDY